MNIVEAPAGIAFRVHAIPSRTLAGIRHGKSLALWRGARRQTGIHRRTSARVGYTSDA
jgi:hypothetical protein